MIREPEDRKGILSSIASKLELPYRWWSRAEEAWGLVLQTRDYYDGRHPVRLNKTMKSILNMRGQDYWFGVNYCQTIIDEMANRLNIEAVQTEDDGELQEWIDQVLEDNNFEVLQSDVHVSALRDGDVFVIGEWDGDENRVKLSLNYRFNGDAGVLPIYENGEMSRAVKIIPMGVSGEDYEVMVYSKWEVQHYLFNGSDGLFLLEESDWVVGQIPVVQFSNRRLLGREYGFSELLSMLGLQDALNATVITAMGAGYLAGFPTSVWKGPLPVDVNDNSGPPKEVGPGMMITFRADQADLLRSAEFKYNDAPDFSGTIQLITDLVVHIANVTGMSIQASGSMSNERSGEQLKQGEAQLLSKLKNLRIRLSSSWKEVVRLAIGISNEYEGGEYREPKKLTARWSDTQVRNNLEIVDIWRVIYDAILVLNPELAGQLFLRGTSEITKLSDSEIEGFDLRVEPENGSDDERGTAGGRSSAGKASGADDRRVASRSGGGSPTRGSAKEGKRGTPSSSENLAGRGRRAKDARGG